MRSVVGAPSRRGLRTALTVLLLLLPAAVYWGVWDFDFLHYDDDHFVLENPLLREEPGWEALARSFREPHAANWIPLTWLSLRLDRALFGLWAGGYHLTNVVLHALATVLLFAALARMTGSQWRSAFVAAVFAVHPLHVESVAWISERKDVLSGCLWMLTLWCYARYARDGRGPLAYAAVVAGCAAALLAKPMAVTLPFVLLLLDAWPLRRLVVLDRTERGTFDFRAHWRLDGPVVLEKVPLLALAALVSAITLEVQRAGGAVVSGELIPLPARVASAFVAYVRYLGASFWPHDLSVFYPLPPRGASVGGALAALAVLVAVSAAVVRMRRQRGYLAVGWLWFLGTLVPVLGLVQVGAQARADRYMYVPLVGLTIAFAWGWTELWWACFPRDSRWRRALWPLACVLLAALALAGHRQARLWKNSVTLFEHALRVTPENAVAHTVLGAAYAERGEVGAARSHWRKALALRPASATLRNNLAWLLVTDPASTDAEIGEGVALAEQAAAASGRLDPAALDTLAAAYARDGRFERAAAVAGLAERRAVSLRRSDLAREARAHRALFREGRPLLLAPEDRRRGGDAPAQGR